MRFGHFLYHTNPSPDGDAEAIEAALNEARRAEELGYDSVWFSEHHFTGEVVYGDPMVFATAVAMQTKRVLLGFAILEMAMHHPVRVAIQTALLDNLSKGRLLVGVARGSSYNAFEYRGFGTTVQFGKDSIEEAEDLLVKAWNTTDGLEYAGQFWKLALPALRPRPWQKPHPPLYRACVTEESVAEMGKQGRLVLFRTRTPVAAKQHIDIYRQNMLAAGYAEEQVKQNLAKCWMWRDCYVAESTDQALDEYMTGQENWRAIQLAVKARWDPKDPAEQAKVAPAQPTRTAYQELANPEAGENFVGSVDRVTEMIGALKEAGVKGLLLTHHGGVVPPERGLNSMRLLAEKIFPRFR